MICKQSFFLILLLFISTACLFNGVVCEITLDKPALTNFFNDYFGDTKLAEKGLVSLVASIVTPNDQFLASFGYKDPVNKIPASLDDLYYIGSISKTFTAISILQLIEQGKLTLHTSIDQFIPNVPTTIIGDYENFLRLPQVEAFRRLFYSNLPPNFLGLTHFLDKN